jgi:hypothetical protein
VLLAGTATELEGTTTELEGTTTELETPPAGAEGAG